MKSLSLQKKRKNRSFTLIEVVLVMAVIALMLGSIGIALPKVLKKERFERGVSAVQEKMELATSLMLDYDTDLYLIFSRSEKGVRCTYKTAKPLPEEVQKMLVRGAEIPDVKEVRFSEGPLFFSAASATIPRGLLTIVGEKNVEITCPGYPARLRKGKHEIPKCEALYPQKALSSS